MSQYLPRLVDQELAGLFAQLPAISVEGAKGVGKTETVLRMAKSVFRLDDANQRAVVEADLSQLTSGAPPILIDEWQRVPESWDCVRRDVDSGAEPGKFLLTGSASPNYNHIHSGAGRIVTVQMRPLCLAERHPEKQSVSLSKLLVGDRPPISGDNNFTLENYVDEILQTGFPGMRDYEGRALRTQLDSYLERLVDHDFELMGYRVRNRAGLLQWMRSYAAATATTASLETIRDSATNERANKPARPTIQAYREALLRLWILDPIDAWAPSDNELKRLSFPPKHHLVDPGLAARLLGATKESLLEFEPAAHVDTKRGPLVGLFFESLVSQNIRVLAQALEGRVAHFRTKAGEREVDLIIERQDKKVLAIEVKLKATIDDDDVRSLLWLRQKLGDNFVDAMVITTGRTAYRRKDGVAVVPAVQLGL